MTPGTRIAPIERTTGRSWADWLRFMEAIDAASLDHHQIALRVYEELDGTVDQLGWWTQAVTVAYEQHVGRRVPGQRPDGTFQTSVSRATPLGMRALMDAWCAFAEQDAGLQALLTGDVRVSGTDRRLTWRVRATDGSSIIVTSEPKGTTASLVAAQIGLPTLEAHDLARAAWTSRVTRFLDGWT